MGPGKCTIMTAFMKHAVLSFPMSQMDGAGWIGHHSPGVAFALLFGAYRHVLLSSGGGQSGDYSPGLSDSPFLWQPRLLAHNMREANPFIFSLLGVVTRFL